VLVVLPVDTVKYLPFGYMFAGTDPAVIPHTIADGGVIKVFYVPDFGQTVELSYTVEYYQNGAKIAVDTVTDNVWVNDPHVLVVLPVDTVKYLPFGYMFAGTDPAVIPHTIADGGVIKVFYVIDETMTRDLIYTVEYTFDGVVKESYTVTVPVWINAPADVAVPVAPIDAPNNRYPGYVLVNDPFVAPLTAQHGDVITVAYIKDDSQTRDVVYTVKYTLDGVVKESYTVTVPVWINAPADVAVPVAPIDAPNNRYPGYVLVNDPFVAPLTARHGDVITVEYIKFVDQIVMTAISWNSGGGNGGGNGGGINQFTVNGITLRNNRNYMTPADFNAATKKAPGNNAETALYTVDKLTDIGKTRLYEIRVALFDANTGIWKIYGGTALVDNPGGNNDNQTVTLSLISPI